MIEAAATASPDLAGIDGGALEAWVAALPDAEKTSILVRLVGAARAHLQTELLRRFREANAAHTSAAKTNARTVAELLKAAEARAKRAPRIDHGASVAPWGDRAPSGSS